MSFSRFVTKGVSDTNTEYLPDSDRKYWIKVRALNQKEKRERESMILREHIKRPKTAAAARKMQEADFEETSMEYLVGKVKEYEYQKCIVDFILPYQPEDSDDVIDFRKSDPRNTRDDVQHFYDNMPDALVEWVDEQINLVNKEGKAEKDAEAVKND